jgi:RNA polymerase sigma-70 factor (ECF subfamily)
MRTALSLLRKRDPSAEVAAAAADDHLLESVLQELPGDDEDPEIRYVRERYAGELRAAVRAAIAALPAEERTLLRLYFVEGLSIDEIGRIHRVHRATAARRIARLREGLLENVRRELSAKLHLSPSEFQSVVRAVGSRLEVSLMTLLERE